MLRMMPTFLSLRRPHPANSFTGQPICPVHRSTCEQCMLTVMRLSGQLQGGQFMLALQ